MLAMIGEATLVPPKTSQPDSLKLSKTSTPVFGLATAETSATARRLQCAVMLAMFCQVCCASNALQPLPAPLQAVSVQPRALLARVSVVPPTAVTKREAAGYSTPKPPSPELAVIATPGWL